MFASGDIVMEVIQLSTVLITKTNLNRSINFFVFRDEHKISLSNVTHFLINDIKILTHNLNSKKIK